MRVAVTGGTGFVGIHTVRALKDAGHEVVVVARGTVRQPKGERVTFVRADVTNSPKLVETFAGCDAVVHLVAVIREKGRQTFDRVNREATVRVAEAAKRGEGRPPRLPERARRRPRPALPVPGEQVVRRAGRAREWVPYTTLRPGLIFGTGRRLLHAAHADDAHRAGHPHRRQRPDALPADRHPGRDPVHRAAVERGPSEKVHEIGGPDQMTLRRDHPHHQVSSSACIASWSHVPVPMMMPLAFMMEKVLPNPPVTRDQLRMLAQQQHHARRLGACRVRFRRRCASPTTATTCRTTEHDASTIASRSSASCIPASTAAGRQLREHAAQRAICSSSPVTSASATARSSPARSAMASTRRRRMSSRASPRSTSSGPIHAALGFARRRHARQDHRLRPQRARVSREQPAVINGASDLFVQVLGPERGAHARSAIGVAQLPLGAAVEVEAIVEIARWARTNR